MVHLGSKDRHCEKASEFLDEISLRSGNFAVQGPNYWIFRGQAEAWPLVPTAHRSDGRLEELVGLGKKIVTNRDQAEFEKIAASRFFDCADRTGLPLPEDSQALRRSLGDTSDDALLSWPEEGVLSLLGLAQHSGLPTRLLDWTWNPYVAAYFAARDVLRAHRTVSATSPGLLRVIAWSPAVFATSLNPGIAYSNHTLHLVTAPTAQISTLHSQRGLFTLDRSQGMNLDDQFTATSLERVVEGQDPSAEWSVMMAFKNFYLSHSEAGALVYLLEQEGVSTATMFPDYVGIVHHLTEQADSLARKPWRS